MPDVPVSFSSSWPSSQHALSTPWSAVLALTTKEVADCTPQQQSTCHNPPIKCHQRGRIIHCEEVVLGWPCVLTALLLHNAQMCAYLRC